MEYASAIGSKTLPVAFNFVNRAIFLFYSTILKTVNSVAVKFAFSQNVCYTYEKFNSVYFM